MVRIPLSFTAVLVGVALSISAVAAEAQSSGDAPTAPEIRMSSVALNVTDIERSEKFYNEVFGLERTFEFESQGNLIEIGLGRPGGGMGFLLAHFNDDPLPEDGRVAKVAVALSEQPTAQEDEDEGNWWERRSGKTKGAILGAAAGAGIGLGYGVTLMRQRSRG